MRAGSLHRIIRIERAVETIDAYGVPAQAWEALATLRADVVQTLDETRHGSGKVSETTSTFTMRFLDDLSLADRILYRGQAHEIVGIVEIGRRKALKVQTVARGAP